MGGPGKKSYLLEYAGAQEQRRVELDDVPLDVRIATKSRRAYVQCFSSLQSVDLDSFHVVGQIPLADLQPHNKKGFWGQLEQFIDPRLGPAGLGQNGELRVDSSEEKAFLLPRGQYGVDHVWAIDLKAFKLLESLPAAMQDWAGAVSMASSADGGTLYILGHEARGSNNSIVHIVDAKTFKETGTWTINLDGPFPYRLGPGSEQFLHQVFDMAPTPARLGSAVHMHKDVAFLQNGQYVLERFEGLLNKTDRIILRDGVTLQVLKSAEMPGQNSIRTHVEGFHWIVD
jgi:hypothetical protein